VAISAKAEAIEIDELKKVMAKPAPKPETAEMAIWRHFGGIEVDRDGPLSDVPLIEVAFTDVHLIDARPLRLIAMGRCPMCP